ncbi:ATP-binding protein [Actinacidiphila epipremni]|uniref:ATP-binding protein n=1 Tax=Actinacidiphila epipremni TaxID=2053013 RepID=A0ABX0ZZS5_9ACTN|nr:ATP-binding protein [Actinacidiphila epipremni]NJP47098.1 ATP-binding protein [Actinacidiphila epipremni]
MTARRAVMRIVREWQVPLAEERLEDLQLLSGEVIANAVRHTQAACSVKVRWTGVRVRVEVTDTSPVRPKRRQSRLAQVDHRAFFEGPMLPVTAPDLWDGAEEDSVFEGSIDCNPHDPDPRLRIPVANLQISVGRWILRLDPDDLADIAAKLRAHADLLDHKIRPALTAARNDWAVHHPQ